jgi:hypothetical protein
VKRKAEVKMVVDLVNPDGVWEHVQDVTYETDEQVSAFLVQQIVKVYAEGGLLKIHGPYDVEHIGLPRIKNIRIKAEEKMIALGGSISQAALDEAKSKATLEVLRGGKR